MAGVRVPRTDCGPSTVPLSGLFTVAMRAVGRWIHKSLIEYVRPGSGMELACCRRRSRHSARARRN